MTPHATATPLPPGIEVPDEVQTRLGTLRFFDGFPDDATTQTLFDNLDFQRAVQAYLLALPPVDLAALRLALSKWGPVNSTVAVWEDLLHPRTIFLTGNTSTAYVAAWLDLHDGPLVLDAAPGVYGLTSDSWGRWVVDVGLTGPDKGQGGRYLLLPPGYDGDVPDGYFVVRPRTYGMLPALRGFRDEHGDPHPAVEVIKAHTRVYPLAQADDPPPTRFVNVSPEPWVTIPPADYRFWDILNEVVQSEPPESSDPVTLGMFAAVGIQHGRPFALDERMRAILTEAATVGDATARALFYRFRQSEAYYYPDSAWRTVFVGGYQLQDHGVALLDSASQFFFEEYAESPAQEQKVVGAGSQSPFAFVDPDGAPFDGGKSYRLHVPAGVPVNTFWSVIAYDTQTRSMLQTNQEWPSVTSQDRDFVTMRTAPLTSTSAPNDPSIAPTGSRPSPARAGTWCSGSTARSNHGSTRPGGSRTSNRSGSDR